MKIDSKSFTEDHFYKVNQDFTGARQITDSLETVQFRNNSTLRIWYNNVTDDFDLHWHNALEVIIPAENYYEVTVNQNTFHVNPEEILIIPPRELHSIHAPEQGARFLYLFDISFLSMISGYSSVLSILTRPLYITMETCPALYREIFESFDTMKNLYFENHEYSDLLIYSHLLKLFALLVQNQIQQLNLPEDTNSGRKREYAKKFLQIIEYIDAHFSDDLNLEAIANLSGFSKFHFSRLFKQYTGFTFCDYLNYRRIKQAEEFLTNQEYSITEVALMSGFTSISTFNRLFKQTKGCSPSGYRSKNHYDL